MNIKITNGEVVIKDVLTRGAKKKINQAMFENVGIKAGQDGKSEFDNFNMANMDKANDIAMIEMIEKITINDKDVPINLDTLDSLSSADAEKVINEINKITNKSIPNA